MGSTESEQVVGSYIYYPVSWRMDCEHNMCYLGLLYCYTDLGQNDIQYDIKSNLWQLFGVIYVLSGWKIGSIALGKYTLYTRVFQQMSSDEPRTFVPSLWYPVLYSLCFTALVLSRTKS